VKKCISEFLGTFSLVFAGTGAIVINQTSDGVISHAGIAITFAIGGVIALEAMFAGPISGASMNPARSLRPAIIANNFSFLWIYLLAPLAGALLAVPLCICVREKGCCSGTPIEQTT